MLSKEKTKGVQEAPVKRLKATVSEAQEANTEGGGRFRGNRRRKGQGFQRLQGAFRGLKTEVKRQSLRGFRG